MIKQLQLQGFEYKKPNRWNRIRAKDLNEFPIYDLELIAQGVDSIEKTPEFREFFNHLNKTERLAILYATGKLEREPYRIIKVAPIYQDGKNGSVVIDSYQSCLVPKDMLPRPKTLEDLIANLNDIGFRNRTILKINRGDRFKKKPNELKSEILSLDEAMRKRVYDVLTNLRPAEEYHPIQHEGSKNIIVGRLLQILNKYTKLN